MDTALSNGDMKMDICGNVQMTQGLNEIVQRAMIRLKMRRGNFSYDTNLGSTLHQLDCSKVDDFTLLSVVRDALAPIEEIVVSGIEKMLDFDKQVMYLTVYLKVFEQDAILEMQEKLW